MAYYNLPERIFQALQIWRANWTAMAFCGADWRDDIVTISDFKNVASMEAVRLVEQIKHCSIGRTSH